MDPVVVQADKGQRPWERPGALRRDCEPDRARFLMLLGMLSLVSGFLSFLLLPALVAVALGLAVWVMSSRDSKKMGAGLMDRRGWKRTCIAERWASGGLLLGVSGLVYWGVLALAMLRWH